MNAAHKSDKISGEQLARQIAELMDDKKGLDITVLDVRGLANFTDYFIVATGRTDRQVKAIHDAVREGMKETFEMLPTRTEGEMERRWILLDYGDCIAHVMQPETRDFYRLEQLWGDAPRLDIEFAPHSDAVAEAG
ncbi:MAG TPA: ribosome silencing factor [Solirubrobacterales bacterium]|jgi:ribosome-associated protein|nr:ribosome silencing factor [Solirubrobacterales bacterium]